MYYRFMWLAGRYYLGDCSLGQDCCGKHCDVDALVQPEFELQTLQVAQRLEQWIINHYLGA